MKPVRIAILLMTLGCFFPVDSLHAGQRLCRIVYPERPGNAPKTAYLFDGKQSRMATLPSMNFSEIIRLPDGDVTLAMTQMEISDPKLLPAAAPILRIPKTVGDFYIILTEDSKNKHLPVAMNLVDTGAGKLKPGEALWFNLTDHKIFAKLGSADLSIDPKGRVVTKKPVEASGYFIARFAYQEHGKGPLAPITEQSWWYDVESRHLGFMVNTGGKLPRIYYFRDFRDPEPTAEEKAALANEVNPEDPAEAGN